MNKIVLIGGGDVGRGNTSYETKEIDEEIVKLSNKETPEFLFIGLASSFSDSYYDVIKKIYKNLGCNTLYLKKKNIINNIDLAIDKITKADIIYFGGGDTIKLLEELTNYKLDKVIKELDNKVLVGISAGAIILSKEGFSDSLILRNESNEYEFIKGLELTNISICPHYNIDIEKTNQLKNKIKDRTIYGLENQTALVIQNNNIKIIKSSQNKNIYKLNKFEEQILS